MPNLPEIKATDLNSVAFPANESYIIIQSENQPFTCKIKLSEFKKWINEK